MDQLPLVLLPGLDGSGVLFRPLLEQLAAHLQPVIVRYPPAPALGYEELLPFVLQSLPSSLPFVLLGESFSGPLALMAAERSPPGLLGVILCASFVRSPVLTRCLWVRHVVRPLLLGAAPEFLRSSVLLGRHATPALRQLAREALAGVSPRVISHRVRALMHVDVRRQLVACNVPVLYLQATEDRLVRQRNVADVVESCPSAQVVQIAAPHFLLQAQPAGAAAAIVDFIGGLPVDWRHETATAEPSRNAEAG